MVYVKNVNYLKLAIIECLRNLGFDKDRIKNLDTNNIVFFSDEDSISFCDEFSQKFFNIADVKRDDEKVYFYFLL